MTSWNFQDLSGNVYGRLTVISRAGKDKRGQTTWNCRCICGKEKVVAARHLKSHAIQSCGCLNLEKTIERSTKHGKFGTKIYNAWSRIKERCTNPNNKHYPSYGGRGIKLYPDWYEFEPFYEYVSKLENYGRAGYTSQSRNKRSNIFVEYQGRENTLGRR